MGRHPIAPPQAAYLRELQQRASVAQHVFDAVLRGIALAAGDNGDVSYDLGPEPWVEVREKPSGNK